MMGLGGFGLISLSNMLPDLSSLEYLGGAKTVAGGVTSITTGALPPRDVMVILASVPGLSGADNLALRFNGDAGVSYWSRIFTSPDVSGAATFSNLENVSKTLLQVDNVGTANTRHFLGIVQNRSASTKILAGQTTTDSGSTATVSTAQLGGGEWINTTAAISTITLTTVGGLVTFNANTNFGVFGRNVP